MTEIGAQPTPVTEPPERFPGGADALADEEKYGVIPDEAAIPDLTAVRNPALEESPEELREPEESQDSAGDDASEDSDESDEPDEPGDSGEPEQEPSA